MDNHVQFVLSLTVVRLVMTLLTLQIVVLSVLPKFLYQTVLVHQFLLCQSPNLKF